MVTEGKTSNVLIASGASSPCFARGDVSAESTSGHGDVEPLGTSSQKRSVPWTEPHLWSVKLGVMICGKEAAPVGLVLFISKRSKET